MCFYIDFLFEKFRIFEGYFYHSKVKSIKIKGKCCVKKNEKCMLFYSDVNYFVLFSKRPFQFC